MRKDWAAIVVPTVIVLAGIGVALQWWRAERIARIEADVAQVLREEQEARQKAIRALENSRPDRVAQMAASRAAGVAYLLKQQFPDGAWRSDVYATFKDGPALTPLVVCALQEADAGVKERRAGSEYLAKLVKPDGTITGGNGDLDYPVYTAALAVTALSHPDNKDLLKARDGWLKFLLDRQLTETLGWQPADKPYGGWGYCRLLPKKPVPGELAPPLVESNLSATTFTLEALKAAGVKSTELYAKSLTFVRRCQNWVPEAGQPAPHIDGGFFFIYDDPVRNKAGSLDLAPAKPERFHSYGSTTADGLRCLLLAGEKEAGRVAAATDWLRLRFRADTHPGEYIAAHERNREAVYFYYAASAAKALRAAGITETGGKPGRPWALRLATELVKRQKGDGSWSNPADLVRENDPIVATSQALIALANCK